MTYASRMRARWTCGDAENRSALRGSGPFNLVLGSGVHEALVKPKGQGIANGGSLAESLTSGIKFPGAFEERLEPDA